MKFNKKKKFGIRLHIVRIQRVLNLYIHTKKRMTEKLYNAYNYIIHIHTHTYIYTYIYTFTHIYI